MGKTISVLTGIEKIISEDKRNGMHRRVLVFAPLLVCEQVWPNEIEGWEHTCHLRYRLATGTPAQRLHALNDPKAQIVITNYENMAWTFEQFGKTRGPFTDIIMDEVDKMKAVKSRRFLSIRHIAPDFDIAIGATGTPTPEHEHNLWGPVYLVTSDRADAGGIRSALGTSKSKFLQNYFDTNQYTRKVVAKPGARAAIGRIIKPYVYLARARDHLKDLPELIYKDTYFDLPPKARKIYDQFEKDAVLFLEKGGEWSDDEEFESLEVEAANSGVLKNKLRQLCSGFMYDADRKIVRFHKAKKQLLDNLKSELVGEQLLVVYAYLAEVDAWGLKNRLGGGVPVRIKNRLITDWNAGALELLGIHPMSAGHGLNLQKSGAYNICIATAPWSAGQMEQVIGRLLRMGQRSNVIVHRFIARDTVEEDVIKALQDKKNMAEAMFQAMKQRQSS